MIRIGLSIIILFWSLSTVNADHGGPGKMVYIPYMDGKKEPNSTVVLTAEDSRAVVIFLGGGKGQFNWSSNHKSTDFPATNATMHLYKKNISVLVPDWPYSMKIFHGGYKMECGKRCSDESYERLLNVMEYAQKKYPGQPIWIVGHSNGSITIDRFTKYLAKLSRLEELAGAVSSASRKEMKVEAPNFRLAFMHHYNDNCQYNPRSVAETLYKKHKKTLGDNVSLHWIKGGGNGGKWDKKGQCIGGTHSYEFAEEEVTQTLRTIILGDKQ